MLLVLSFLFRLLVGVYSMMIFINDQTASAPEHVLLIKKYTMKKYHFFFPVLFVVGALLFSACEEDEPTKDSGYCNTEASLIGPDYRLCACCGGWFIQIEGETYRALTLPEEFTNSLALYSLPLDIYVEWSPVETPCLGDEIIVDCLEVR